jgi:hypothetical protein
VIILHWTILFSKEKIGLALDKPKSTRYPDDSSSAGEETKAEGITTDGNCIQGISIKATLVLQVKKEQVLSTAIASRASSSGRPLFCR